MPHVLVNLPPGFFSTPVAVAALAELDRFAEVRRTSHNSAEEIADDLAWADSVLMWSWPALDAAPLDRAPNLQFAAHIDLTQRAAREALRRGLSVSVSRAGFSPAVAEMALTLILSTLRRTSAYHTDMALGREHWVASFPDDIDHRERELTGRTVGIIGYGRIGRRLAELLEPFHCPILVADPFVTADQIAGEKVNLDDMASRADVVVVCAAANEGTTRLINAEIINAMRSDALFVNVARAALVDTDALVPRLERGDLYAAIDVFDTEPLPPNHPLRRLPNAFLTPHRAGGTLASVERILTYLVHDTIAFFEGGPRKWALTEAMVPSLDA